MTLVRMVQKKGPMRELRKDMIAGLQLLQKSTTSNILNMDNHIDYIMSNSCHRRALSLEAHGALREKYPLKAIRTP